MNTLEIEAKRAELARSILNIESEEILNEISYTLQKLTAKMPCMYSDEEIRAGADRFISALRSGDKTKFIPQEKLEEKYR